MDNNNPHIYLISGLGADYRVFKKLNLPEGNLTHIEWIKPVSQNESIADYSKRLCSQIKHDTPILIGVSFGGIVSIEIGKHISTAKIILISSVKTTEELPKKYRVSGKLKLNLLIPKWTLNKNSFIIQYLFGIKSKEGKFLLKQIIKDTDTSFMKWAINELLNWKETSVKENIIHIHGNKDRLLPVNLIEPDYLIKEGGHLMIFENNKDVNSVLSEIM